MGVSDPEKDGEIRWIQDLVQVFTDAAGKIDYVNGILFDVTDRKQAEERLQRTSRALKALSACNQALVHATQEKAFLTDVCQVIVREGGYPLAWVGYAQPDQMKSVIHIASAGVEAEHPEWVSLTWGEMSTGKAPAAWPSRPVKSRWPEISSVTRLWPMARGVAPAGF